MTKPVLRVCAIAASALLAMTEIAMADDSHPPEWWQVATGIIAIPAALLGLIYSYFLTQKTRLELQKTKLESRKTELEIREKEGKLAEISPADSDLLQRLLEPATNARLGQLLVLRFVVFYLTLQAWGFLEQLIGLLLTGIGLGVYLLLGSGVESYINEHQRFIMAPYLIFSNLPKVGYWAIFILLGWPLFKDVNAVLGIDFADFLRLNLRGSRRLK